MWDDSQFEYTDAYWESFDGSNGDSELSPRARASLDDWSKRRLQQDPEPDEDGLEKWRALSAKIFGV